MLVDPPIFKLPPTNKFPATPIPPLTTNAPVDDDTEVVVFVTVITPLAFSKNDNCPA